MPTETKLRKPFVKALREIGAVVIPYVGSSYGQQGVSDVFIAHKDWHGWIEFKGPTTQIAPLQQIFINGMRKRNVNAGVIRLLGEHKFQIEDKIYTYLTGWHIIKGLKEHDFCKSE